MEISQSFRNLVEKIKLKITLYLKSYKIKREHSKLIDIVPKPFTVQNAHLILDGVVDGNIVNLSKLVKLCLDSKSTSDFSEVNEVLSQYFSALADVHYRDYFIDNGRTMNILHDPEKHWKIVVDGYRDIKLEILNLESNTAKNPDNYFYIRKLQQVINILEVFIQHIKRIELSDR